MVFGMKLPQGGNLHAQFFELSAQRDCRHGYCSVKRTCTIQNTKLKKTASGLPATN